MFSQIEHIISGAYDYKEALKRQKLKQKDVNLLREQAKQSKLIPRYIHDKQVNFQFHPSCYAVSIIFLFQLLLFINASKGNVEKSSKWLHLYYKIKRSSPEFFKNRDVFSDEIQSALTNQIYLSLPVTPNNCNVVFHKLANFNPKVYDFDASIKTFIMTAEACGFKHGPRNATIFVYGEFERYILLTHFLNQQNSRFSRWKIEALTSTQHQFNSKRHRFSTSWKSTEC